MGAVRLLWMHPFECIRVDATAGCERHVIACGSSVATCKTHDFHGKVAKFETLSGPASQKEKKISNSALDLLRFFRGTSFAIQLVALTISSPETNSVCPQAKAGLLEPWLPTAVPPIVARPFFFHGDPAARFARGPHLSCWFPGELPPRHLYLANSATLIQSGLTRLTFKMFAG